MWLLVRYRSVFWKARKTPERFERNKNNKSVKSSLLSQIEKSLVGNSHASCAVQTPAPRLIAHKL